MLVDYSDSDEEDDTAPEQEPTPATTSTVTQQQQQESEVTALPSAEELLGADVSTVRGLQPLQVGQKRPLPPSAQSTLRPAAHTRGGGSTNSSVNTKSARHSVVSSAGQGAAAAFVPPQLGQR